MLKRLLFIFQITLLLFVFLAQPVSSLEENASPSSNLNDLSEIVKKRIQGLIEEQATRKTQSLAYGKLASIVTNTLSIETDNGVKLASTSAETSYIRLPGSTKISHEDLAIDEYIVAIGPENDNQVISALKVLSQKTPPENSVIKSFFGVIYTYDSKKYILTLENPQTKEQRVFTVGRKSSVFLADPDGTKANIDRKQDLPIESQALVIFEPNDNPDTEITIQELLVSPSSPIITPPELQP